MTDEHRSLTDAIRETERRLSERHGSFVNMLSATYTDALYQRVYGPINIQQLKEHAHMNDFRPHLGYEDRITSNTEQTLTIPRETLLQRLREQRDEFLLTQKEKDALIEALDKLRGDLDAITRHNLTRRIELLAGNFEGEGRSRFIELERLIDLYELATDESYTFTVREATRLLNL